MDKFESFSLVILIQKTNFPDVTDLQVAQSKNCLLEN